MGWMPFARKIGISTAIVASVPMLNIAGENAGTKNRRSEFSIPMKPTATAISVRKGNITRASETASSSLPGTAA